jgi:5-methyltetrahydropteroyltriglutamate--homocysteine methyltransferase
VVILPGAVTRAANVVEHSELVAYRIVRSAEAASRENVIASIGCGLGGRVHPQIARAQPDTLVKGAEMATGQI